MINFLFDLFNQNESVGRFFLKYFSFEKNRKRSVGLLSNSGVSTVAFFESEDGFFLEATFSFHKIEIKHIYIFLEDNYVVLIS